MPKVSVVIPSYNHAPFIAEAVQSVLAQSEGDLELIVVDDGSTDDTLARLAALRDRRLRIETQTNLGAHAALNRGLRLAQGAYRAILNSDDVYHPRRLEQLIAVLDQNPASGLAGSYIQVIDQAGNPGGIKRGYHSLSPWALACPERSFRAADDWRGVLATENYWATTSNFVLSRRGYEQGIEFRNLRYTHDWDFLLRLAPETPLTMVPEPLLSYRLHRSNTIRENQAAMIFEICWILAEHLPRQVSDPWFTRYDPARQTELLLNSLFTYHCDRVLNLLLLSRLGSGNNGLTFLLDPANPARNQFIAYIEERLTEPEAPPARARSRPFRFQETWRKIRRLRIGPRPPSR